MSTLKEIKVTTAPSTEPITLAEARSWIKLKDSFTDDDTLISGTLIPAARRRAEKYLNRSIITQVVTLYYTEFQGEIHLPYGPFQSIDSVTRIYLNETTALTVNSDYYVTGLDDKVITIAGPHTQLNSGHSPNDKYTGNDLKIVATVGYGVASAVPEEIKEAIRMMVSESYSERKGYVVGESISGIKKTAKSKLSPYRFLPM